jgi:DNA modification methylase
MRDVLRHPEALSSRMQPYKSMSWMESQMTTNIRMPTEFEHSLRNQIKAKGRGQRKRLAKAAQAAAAHCLRKDIMPPVQFVEVSIDELKAPTRKLRKDDLTRVKQIAKSMSDFQFYGVILIDKDNSIVDGHVRFEAAKLLGLRTLRCIRVDHLSDVELRLLRLAIGRLGETAQWDLDEIRIEFVELIRLGADIGTSGFSISEVGQIIIGDRAEGIEEGPLAPEGAAVAVAQSGDMFQVGPHRVNCGDATNPDVLSRLMVGVALACLVLTDQPYNVKIAGNVTRGNHREFAMASGEMSGEGFLSFNLDWMRPATSYLRDGGIIATFIDWRGAATVANAAAELGLEPLNLVVWAKTNAGMGSLYRSGHELLPLFKKGDAPHVNNVQLGKHGRWRSNVWTYPGASAFGSDARQGLKDHPTVKPVAMLQDALIDLTNRGDIVLDPFLGSGSTLIAAEKMGRICHGVELDPLYVDVIIRRYAAVTGKSAVLVETGETFEALALRRSAELQQPGAP